VLSRFAHLFIKTPHASDPIHPMRLLYFTPQQIWPVNSGSRLRNYNLARQLAARASVTVVEMGDGGEEQRISKENFDLANVVTLDKGRAYSPSIILPRCIT